MVLIDGSLPSFTEFCVDDIVANTRCSVKWRRSLEAVDSSIFKKNQSSATYRSGEQLYSTNGSWILFHYASMIAVDVSCERNDSEVRCFCLSSDFGVGLAASPTKELVRLAALANGGGSGAASPTPTAHRDLLRRPASSASSVHAPTPGRRSAHYQSTGSLVSDR